MRLFPSLIFTNRFSSPTDHQMSPATKFVDRIARHTKKDKNAGSFGRGRVPLGLGRGKFMTTKRAPSRFASNCEKDNHQIHTPHKLNFHIAIIHVVSSIPLLISVYTIHYILFCRHRYYYCTSPSANSTKERKSCETRNKGASNN